MIQNSAEINFGGLRIVAVRSDEFPYHPNYEITVTTTGTIFKGSPAKFESMCESHRDIVSVLKLVLTLLKDGYLDADVSPTVKLAEEALRRAE